MSDPIPLFTVYRGNDDALEFEVDLPAGETLQSATLSAQLRTSLFGPIEQLTAVSLAPDHRRILVSWTAAQSADWPLTSATAPALTDVLVNRTGQLSNSYPVGLIILEGVTKPGVI
jgi:hypothetical protein